MKSGLFTLAGFLLLALGLLSIILSMVGVQFAFMSWMNTFGAGVAFVFKLLMIVFGIVMMYLARGGLRPPD